MSRDDQNADKPLEDFDALFRNQQEQQDHVQTVHHGVANIEFTSVWDKKETPNSMVHGSQTQMIGNPDPMKPYPTGQMGSYNQYYQAYPNMHYQPYYRPSGSDPYNQFSFGQFSASQSMAPLVNQPEVPSTDSGYDFYQSQNVQPTYHASNVVATTPPMPKPTPPPPTLELPKFVKEEVKSEAPQEKNIKKESDKDEKNGKPRYNSIVFANEF